MNVKKYVSAAFLIAALVPLAASAQSADDAILNLLTSLDTPLFVQDTSVHATSTLTTQPVTSVKKPAATVPEQEVLTPFHLFDIDTNAPKADPQVSGLKAALAAILAQYADVASRASSTPVTTSASSTASTSAAVVAPKKTFLRDLTIGSRGADVKQLQMLLIARGLLFGDATGYFGVLTKTAVLAFQTDQGLPSVGNVGPRTRAVLNSIPLDESGATKIPTMSLPGAVAFIASSTSVRASATTTAGTSTAQSASSTTPLFDPSAPPVSVSMTVLPTDAAVGDKVSITWLSLHADTCMASDGWDGPKPTIGAAQVGPLQFSLNFVLTCTGAGGEASTTALVVVGGEQ